MLKLDSQINIRVKKSDVQTFKRLYKCNINEYLRKSIRRAIINKEELIKTMLITEEEK